MLLHPKSSFAFLHCLKKQSQIHLPSPASPYNRENDGFPKGWEILSAQVWEDESATVIMAMLWLAKVAPNGTVLRFVFWDWVGCWWDNAALLPIDQHVEASVSCWDFSGIGYGGCNCLKASPSHLAFCFSWVFHILMVPWALPGTCFCSSSKLLSCASFSSFMKLER